MAEIQSLLYADINSASFIYGEAFSVRVKGGDGSGGLVFNCYPVTGKATISQSGASCALTFVEPGIVWVTCYRESDRTYQQSRKLCLEVVLHQRTITIQVRDISIYVGQSLPSSSYLSQQYTALGLQGSDSLSKKPTVYFVDDGIDTNVVDSSGSSKYVVAAHGAEVPDTTKYDPRIKYQTGTFTVEGNKTFRIFVANTYIMRGRITASSGSKPNYTQTYRITYNYGYKLLDTWVTNISTQERIELTKISGKEFTFLMPTSNVIINATYQIDDSILAKTPYTDVPANSKYDGGIRLCYKHKIMTGTSATTFGYNQNATRAQTILAISRIYNETWGKSELDYPGWNPYSDVPNTDSYAAYRHAIVWGTYIGVLKGTSSTTYNPDNAITREQLCTVLYRYAKFCEYDVSTRMNVSSFNDSDEISGWAANGPISWAVSIYLIGSDGLDNLNPKDLVTRPELAEILARFCQMYAWSNKAS